MERTKKDKKDKKAKKEAQKRVNPIKPSTEGKKGQESGLLRFRKIGSGVFRMNGRIIKPNEEFYAHFDQIPKAFRNVIICLDEKELIAIQSGAIGLKRDKAKFEIKQVLPNQWNVINSTGKVMNETPLTEEEAIKLADILSN